MNSHGMMIDPGLIAVTGAMLVALVAIVGGIWHKVRHAEFDAALRQEELQLKREMIQRGMSADEIEQVLNARSTTDERPNRCGRMAQRP